MSSVLADNVLPTVPALGDIDPASDGTATSCSTSVITGSTKSKSEISSSKL